MTTRILARFERHRLEAEHAKALNQAIGEAAEQATTKRDLHLVADGAKLRGIPAIGKFANAGAIRGTNPEAEAVRRDGLRRRRA